MARKLIIFVLCVTFLASFPSPAEESGLDVPNLPLDFGYVTAPLDRQTVIFSSLTEKYSKGNGTCVPYARSRTGIQLFGAAKTFLKQAPALGYGVSAQPVVGAMVITSEGGGHVAVVEQVGTSSLVISEQNYLGLYQISKRTLDFSAKMILGYIIP